MKNQDHGDAGQKPRPDMLNIAETAEFLRTSEATVRSWMCRGQLGKEHGLIYVASKPFFLFKVLNEQRNSGLLGGKRARKKRPDLA